MFQLADPKKPVKWPVKIKFPGTKGQEVEKSFAASFYFKTEDEITKLSAELDDIKFLQSVISCFHELRDHTGKPIKGTAKDIQIVASNTRLRHALINAFYDFNSGDVKN